MSESTGDAVSAACWRQEDGLLRMLHSTWASLPAALASRDEGSERAWVGDVFFDHLRGVLDESPEPLFADGPFLLVTHTRDFDWTGQHETGLEEYADAAELLRVARGLVDNERSSGNYNRELWEVYGVRVLRRTHRGAEVARARWRFTITTRDGATRRLARDEAIVAFGAARDCQVVLTGDGIAPVHCRLAERDGRRIVENGPAHPRTLVDGDPITLWRTLRPPERIGIGDYTVHAAPPELTSDRRAGLVSADALRQIGERFGDEAARRYVDDLWSIWGDGEPDIPSVVERIGPFAWVALPKARTPISVPHLFWVNGSWCLIEGVDAFKQALAEATPDLSSWEPVAKAWCALTLAELLATREAAADYADPRWHVMPWGEKELSAWEPPHFDGAALRFCTHSHGALERVTVRQDSFAVDVQTVR